MPEGPEVYNFALQVYDLFYLKQLKKIKILGGKYKKTPFKNFNLLKNILPSKIVSVATLGKILLIELQNNYFLVITFGMTGFMTTDKIKHNHIEFVLEDNVSLFYNDMRNFGNIYLLTGDVLESKIADIGPDILDPNFTYTTFKNRLKYYTEKYQSVINKEICLILLDQTFVSGIGNYLRAEILYYAKINPYVKLSVILKNKQMIKNLYKYIYNVSRYYAFTLYKQNLSDQIVTKIKKHIEQNLLYKLKHIPETYGRTFMVYGEKYDIKNKIIKRDKFKGRSIYYV